MTNRMLNPIAAMNVIHRHRDAILEAPHVPADGILSAAYNAFPQPIRAHLQALAGLGYQVPRQTGDLSTWLHDLHDAPISDKYRLIRQALRSNVWIQVPREVSEIEVQETEGLCALAPMTLISVQSPIEARRIHVVSKTEQLIFLRVTEYGNNGILEIHSNISGPLGEPNPVGRLSRATFGAAEWMAKPGWWIVRDGNEARDEGGGDASFDCAPFA
ncbi:hypothetical protein ABIG06_007330 [Bradyrhizobium sp. USDA 326]|uniref:hypothetical protein n=1 Tax=unclassified Bradyrhizobium TaxID=2631580 RepID=UPI003510FC64